MQKQKRPEFIYIEEIANMRQHPYHNFYLWRFGNHVPLDPYFMATYLSWL